MLGKTLVLRPILGMTRENSKLSGVMTTFCSRISGCLLNSSASCDEEGKMICSGDGGGVIWKRIS